jgi:hypothetical protein
LIPFSWECSVLFGLFHILGDSAYPSNDLMLSIFEGNRLSPHAVAFNRIICPLRTWVEWGCEKIVKYRTFLDFKK